MILRLLILLAFAMPLTATQEGVKTVDFQNQTLSKAQESLLPQDNKEFCKGCDNNNQRSLSGAQVLQIVQKALNDGMFLFPKVQPLVVQEIIAPNISNPVVASAMANVIATSPVVATAMADVIATSPVIANTLATVIRTNGIGGPAGPTGATGAAGATGPAGGLLGIADFYALMPPDNAVPAQHGQAIEFPRTAFATPGITPISLTQFQLHNIGTYLILFQATVTEAAQLVIGLDTSTGATELPYTVVGRDPGATQIVGMSIVTTTSVNEVLTIRDPQNSSTAVTLPLNAGAGAMSPVSAHLIILQVQ